MYKKAIVMEIKAAYAIAMEEGGSIIRIKKKDGLSVGDSIYVLPEDLYQGQDACSDSSLHRFQRKLVPFPGIKKSSLVKIASIAAMLILCITLAVPQLTVTTYAQASFDGAGSIQLSLDRNLQIIKATSSDQSVSDSVLKALHGKHINEVGNTLRLRLRRCPGRVCLDQRKRRCLFPGSGTPCALPVTLSYIHKRNQSGY